MKIYLLPCCTVKKGDTAAQSAPPKSPQTSSKFVVEPQKQKPKCPPPCCHWRDKGCGGVVMPFSYISSTLYKGLFVLVVIFIIIEYFFGIITDNKFAILYNNSSSSNNNNNLKNHELHGPILKTLLFRNKNINGTRNATVFTTPEKTGVVLKTAAPSVEGLHISSVAALFEGNSSTEDNSSYVGAPNANLKISSTSLPLCPEIAPNLRGRIEVVKNPVPTVQQLEQSFSWLQPGGHWAPQSCHVEKKLAIIIPFRCRGEHLLLFLQHMHPFLKRQQLDYTIFIIEQDGDGPFNRATLMNVGYMEALKLRDFDCFIFHDIDLLPEDDRNLYTCPEQPRHMSVAVDIFKYRLPYREIFGGVSAITKDHFKQLNGFSNSFWGWGGEDDDMSNRIKHHHLFISRYPINIARYTMLTHKKDKPSPNRYDVLKQGKDRFDKDGLNNLKYRIVQTKRNLLYTWMLVGVDQPS